MPTETFFNLPGEKRKKLVRAIYNELARVPFSEVSINRIVKEADIARGSYYQYFKGKDDLYGFVLSDYRACLLENAERTLREHGGDLFSTLLAAFDASAAYASEPENLAFSKNLFSHMQLAGSPAADPGRTDACGCTDACGAFFSRLYALANLDALRVEDAGELAMLFEILAAQFRAAVQELVTDVSRAPELRERFAHKLMMLQRGLARESKEDMQSHAG